MAEDLNPAKKEDIDLEDPRIGELRGFVGKLQARIHLLEQELAWQRNQDEKLRRSERWLEQALDGAELGLWEHDFHSDTVIRAGRWASMLGYRADEIENSAQAWRDLIHPDDLPRVRRVATEHEAGRTPVYRAEHRMRTKSGDWKWILNWGRVIERDTDGSPIRAMGIHLDITDRKRAEEELARHRDHLEELVEARGRELERSQDKMRRAERLSSLGTLAAGIAHEINNPLGMILLGVEQLLGATDTTNESRVVLAQIKRDINRCAHIVKGVLRFAKSESTVKQPCDLNRIVLQALNFTRAYVQRHNVQLDERLGENLPLVSVNATDLEQLVINLVHNSVHACEETGRVAVMTVVTPSGVRLLVEDNGRGMSPEQIRQAFDPFYTTRLEQGGTGLGLATCHGIVQDHDGTINISSCPGKGTCVTVELPRLDEGDSDRENEPA